MADDDARPDPTSRTRALEARGLDETYLRDGVTVISELYVSELSIPVTVLQAHPLVDLAGVATTLPAGVRLPASLELVVRDALRTRWRSPATIAGVAPSRVLVVIGLAARRLGGRGPRRGDRQPRHVPVRAAGPAAHVDRDAAERAEPSSRSSSPCFRRTTA